MQMYTQTVLFNNIMATDNIKNVQLVLKPVSLATWEIETFRLHMDRVKRIWYLSPMRTAKVQASLRICAVSPEPPLLAHTSSESRRTFRQKARSLAPLNGWACAVEICHDGMLEDTNSLDGALDHRLSILITELHLSDYSGYIILSPEASVTQRLKTTKSSHRQQWCDKVGRLWVGESFWCTSQSLYTWGKLNSPSIESSQQTSLVNTDQTASIKLNIHVWWRSLIRVCFACCSACIF